MWSTLHKKTASPSQISNLAWTLPTPICWLSRRKACPCLRVPDMRSLRKRINSCNIFWLYVSVSVDLKKLYLIICWKKLLPFTLDSYTIVDFCRCLYVFIFGIKQRRNEVLGCGSLWVIHHLPRWPSWWQAVSAIHTSLPPYPSGAAPSCWAHRRENRNRRSSLKRTGCFFFFLKFCLMLGNLWRWALFECYRWNWYKYKWKESAQPGSSWIFEVTYKTFFWRQKRMFSIHRIFPRHVSKSE